MQYDNIILWEMLWVSWGEGVCFFVYMGMYLSTGPSTITAQVTVSEQMNIILKKKLVFYSDIYHLPNFLNVSMCIYEFYYLKWLQGCIQNQGEKKRLWKLFTVQTGPCVFIPHCSLQS